MLAQVLSVGLSLRAAGPLLARPPCAPPNLLRVDGAVSLGRLQQVVQRAELRGPQVGHRVRLGVPRSEEEQPGVQGMSHCRGSLGGHIQGARGDEGLRVVLREHVLQAGPEKSPEDAVRP